ncbi:hypothetical protein ISF_00045 [Cordyceps fumosorosea ARSEF 2679]|uniref:Uncharacterized protein n=1 Tax=Cordyceps fumosorosea (strain ARSEF 2679) TaxID=1081104 RepID=A0A162LN69_CORFA|nr:hypothetical protein ISF_00045 [Cordyceps fumosorosea ARSEF 2679]OAA73144.1 hypothetical protein ISF_00045 [Cordyceps fumosorosea ARSEF 2679]
MFDAVGLSIDDDTNIDFSDKEADERISAKLIGFADLLIDNFFLPRINEANASAIPRIPLSDPTRPVQ